MTEFKVGDRVVSLGTSNCWENTKGDRGTVENTNKTFTFVRFDKISSISGYAKKFKDKPAGMLHSFWVSEKDWDRIYLKKD